VGWLRPLPLYPFLAQLSSVLLGFSESLMHGPFSCPFRRNLPSVPVRPIPTPIFTNVLSTPHNQDMGSFKLPILPLAERNCSAIRDGIVIAEFSCMGWICQHCGAPFVDSAYRVKSEESGVVLLDIIVCQHCYVEARDLGLHTEKIVVRNSSRARNHSSSRKKPALR